MTCRCESCSPEPLPTYTREYRQACEVRAVAALPNHAERATYLGLVEKKRGGDAAARLREAVWKLMRL